MKLTYLLILSFISFGVSMNAHGQHGKGGKPELNSGKLELDPGYPLETPQLSGLNEMMNSEDSTLVFTFGISEYSNIRPLQFAAHDADSLGKYLRLANKGYTKVMTSTNERINQLGWVLNYISGELEAISVNSRKHWTVMIYFSGHSTDKFLIGASVGKALLESRYPSGEDILKHLELQGLISDYSKDFKNMVLVVDACNSGGLESSNLEKIKANMNEVYSFLSSSSDEKSFERADLGAGVFTHYLLKGISGAADDQGEFKDDEVSGSEIETYLERVGKNINQTPVVNNPDREVPFTFHYNPDLDVSASMTASSNKNKASRFFKTGKSSTDNTSYSSSRIEQCENLMSLFLAKVNNGEYFVAESESEETLNIELVNKLKEKDLPSVDLYRSSKYGGLRGVLRAGQLSVSSNPDFTSAIQIPSNGVLHFSFSPNEEFVAAILENNTVNVYDVYTGDSILSSVNKLKGIQTIEWWNSNTLLLLSEKGHVYKWQPTGEGLKSLNKLEKVLKGVKVPKKMEIIADKMLLLSESGKLVVYDLVMENKVKTFKDGILDFQLMPNGTDLLLANGSSLVLWDLNTKEIKNEVDLEAQKLDVLAHPLNPMIVVATESRRELALLDRNLQQERKGLKLSGLKGNVEVLDYNEVSNVLTVADSKGTILTYVVEMDDEQSAYVIAEYLKKDIKYCNAASEGRRLKPADIDQEMLYSLTKVSESALNHLFNADVLSNEELALTQRVRKNLKWALKNTDQSSFDAEQLRNFKINYNLLEVFEILLRKQSDRYREGLTLLEEIEQLDPDGAYPYNIAGQLYELLDDLKMAKESFEMASIKGPRWKEPKMRLGGVLVKQKEFDKAEKVYKSVIKIDSLYLPAHKELIQLYLNEKRAGEQHVKEHVQQHSFLMSVFKPLNIIAREMREEEWVEVKQFSHADYGFLFDLDLTSIEALNNSFKKHGAKFVSDGSYDSVVVCFYSTSNMEISYAVEAKASVSSGVIEELYLKEKNGKWKALEGFKPQFVFENSDGTDDLQPNVPFRVNTNIMANQARMKQVEIDNPTYVLNNPGISEPLVWNGHPFNVYFVSNFKGDTKGRTLMDLTREDIKYLNENGVNSGAEYKVGDTLQGGIVYYVEPGGEHGLVIPILEDYHHETIMKAKREVKEFQLEGIEDWQLPTRDQLKKLAYSRVQIPVDVVWTSESKDGLPISYSISNAGAEMTAIESKRFILPIRVF